MPKSNYWTGLLTGSTPERKSAASTPLIEGKWVQRLSSSPDLVVPQGDELLYLPENEQRLALEEPQDRERRQWQTAIDTWAKSPDSIPFRRKNESKLTRIGHDLLRKEREPVYDLMEAALAGESLPIPARQPRQYFDENLSDQQLFEMLPIERRSPFAARMLAGLDKQAEGLDPEYLRGQLSASDRRNLADYLMLETDRSVSQGFGRSFSPIATIPATVRGVTAGLVNLPGYKMYRERHPVESTIMELPGSFVPYTQGIRGLQSLGMVSKSGRLLGNAGSRALRDAITLGTIEGLGTLSDGADAEEVIRAIQHGALTGGAFGGVAGLTQPLPAASRIAAQAITGAGVEAGYQRDLSPTTLLQGAAFPAVFETMGAIPEIGYNLYRWRLRNRLSRDGMNLVRTAANIDPEQRLPQGEIGNYLRPTGETVTPEGLRVSLDKRIERTVSTLKSSGISEPVAKLAARGDISLDDAVNRSISADVPRAERSLLFQKRKQAAQARLKESDPAEDLLVSMHSGVPLSDLLDLDRISPEIKSAVTNFMQDFDHAILAADPKAFSSALRKFQRRAQNISTGGIKWIQRNLGRTGEQLRSELPPAVAKQIHHDIATSMVSLEMGNRAIWLRGQAMMKEHGLSGLTDDEHRTLSSLIRGILRFDDQGNPVMATLQAADALEVKTDPRNGLDFVIAYPEGEGGAPIRYYIAGKDITASEAAAALARDQVDMNGVRIVRMGEAITHGNETVKIGDREQLVKPPTPVPTRVELVEVEVPRGVNPETGRQKLERSRKRSTLTARFDDDLAEEVIDLKPDPNPVNLSVLDMKTGESRIPLKGVNWIYDGPATKTRGAQKILLRHPRDRQRTKILPVDNEGNVSVTPFAPQARQSVPISKLEQGKRFYHAGREFEVRIVREPGKQNADPLRTFKDRLRVYRPLEPEFTRATLQEFQAKHPGVLPFIKSVRAGEEELMQTLFGQAISPWSLEAMKHYYEIKTNLHPEAASFPDVVEREGMQFIRCFDSIDAVLKGGKIPTAPGRMFKTGRAASQGRTIERFDIATATRQAEFFTESVYRGLQARLFALTAQPVMGETMPGWVRVGNLQGYGADAADFAKTLRSHRPLMKMYNIQEGDAERAATALMKNMQVPAAVAEVFQRGRRTTTRMADPRGEAFTKGINRFSRAMTNYYTMNLLTRPSTAVRNWISGEILYFNKLLLDTYEGLLDISLFRQDQLPFAALRNDIQAYWGSMSKNARQMIPNEMLGGTFTGSLAEGANFLEHGGSRGLNYGLKTLLVPFREVETIQKRRSMWADFRTMAQREARRMESRPDFRGWEKYGGRDEFILNRMENPTTDMYMRAMRNITEVSGFNYPDKPRFLQQMNRPLGRAIIPYPNWFYNYARLLLQPVEDVAGIGMGLAERRKLLKQRAVMAGEQMSKRTKMVNMDPAWQMHDETVDPRNFDLSLAKNSAELKRKLARLMASATMWWIADQGLDLFDAGFDRVEGEELPWEHQTGGRIRLGKINGRELYWRIYDQPYFGERMWMRDSMSGDRFLEDYFGDRVSLGYAANASLIALGYRDDFNQFKTTGSRMAELASSFIPAAGWLKTARRIGDPTMRQTEEPGYGFGDSFMRNIADQSPWTSRLLDPRVNSATGEEKTYEMWTEILKLMFLNVKPIDPDERDLAVETEINQAIEKAIGRMNLAYGQGRMARGDHYKKQRDHAIEQLNKLGGTQR